MLCSVQIYNIPADVPGFAWEIKLKKSLLWNKFLTLFWSEELELKSKIRFYLTPSRPAASTLPPPFHIIAHSQKNKKSWITKRTEVLLVSWLTDNAEEPPK